MSEAVAILTPEPEFRVDPSCLAVRRANFPDEISFHMPGLKLHNTSEVKGSMTEFVSVSVTGSACALNCEHCQTKVLDGMVDLPASKLSLYETCANLANDGARGVLISGGSDLKGRVPLKEHMKDLKRIREELGMVIRVHVGIPDEETCAALGDIDIDGAMLDIIGDRDTIRDVYHLDRSPDDYEKALELLEKYSVPAIPHIIIGHYFGEMKGEWNALEMIRRHALKSLVLVILMPISGTPMAGVTPPELSEIGNFFQTARLSMKQTPVMLGCAKPLGPIKYQIDKLAVEAGLNGIAYPADGIVSYSERIGLEPLYINACCGVTW